MATIFSQKKFPAEQTPQLFLLSDHTNRKTQTRSIADHVRFFQIFGDWIPAYNASANIPAAVLWCSSLCCRQAIQKSGRKLRRHVTRCLAKAWATPAYPTSRWDVAVIQMVTATGRRSLSNRQKHRNYSSVSSYFAHRIAWIWTRLTMPYGVLCSRRSTIIQVSQLTK